MKTRVCLRLTKGAVSCLTVAVLVACASASPEHTLQRLNDQVSGFTGNPLSLARTASERQARADVAQKLLAKPVGQDQAVQLALANSHALQALLAQGWAQSTQAAQQGLIANPLFSFERVVTSGELELGRVLSLGLMELLTLPTRQGLAQRRVDQAQLRLAGEVVDQVTKVRQAWVRAVAAQQILKYAHQVYDSAQASAELARRMQAVGNFNRISRAREQTFYADAAVRLAAARHGAQASREELVRLLGLDDAQAHRLTLPERLPDLPRQVLAPEAVSAMLNQARLDIRFAQAELEASSQASGFDGRLGVFDIELTASKTTQFDHVEGVRTNMRAYELAVRLPVFDWGSLRADASDARTLAAVNQLEATIRSAGSHLRESYSAYRTTYDIAKHYRDEVVPVRQVISQENLLRYNGMMIGVFELLADAREQVGVVMSAIDAQQQFWLADAALQAAVIGRPTSTALSVAASASPGGAGH